MQRRIFHRLVHGLTVLILLYLSATAEAASRYGISGPFVHGNLAVYMISGPSRAEPVPLTLQEALAGGAVNLKETGDISRLEIENRGDRAVFLQAGDLVKGGRQDRVLSVSLLLRPRSGPVAVGAYCVERGRWGARPGEDSVKFASADFALPSRRAKLAIEAAQLLTAVPRSGALGTSPQTAVWRMVAAMQHDLSASLAMPVASARSPSSLQLTLESGALSDATARYVGALKGHGNGNPDIIGYAFAINGVLNSADVYPSHGLFKKLWPKLLRASATEAIVEANKGQNTTLPSADAVLAFLRHADDGTPTVRMIGRRDRLERRDGERAVLFQTFLVTGEWVHRNYVAKSR